MGSCPHSKSSDLISLRLGAKADKIPLLYGCVSLLSLLPKLGVESVLSNRFLCKRRRLKTKKPAMITTSPTDTPAAIPATLEFPPVGGLGAGAGSGAFRLSGIDGEVTGCC